MEFIFENTISFMLDPQTEILGINVTKCVENLEEENHKILVEESRKGRGHHENMTHRHQLRKALRFFQNLKQQSRFSAYMLWC